MGNNHKVNVRSNPAKTIYSYTTWIWIILALAELTLQATRTVDVSPDHELAMFYGEIAITIAFDFEIGLRLLATLPDWRTFFQHGNNWLDTILAIAASIIQIPAIRHSSVYAWFTIFQLARFYRVILVVPRMKPLLVRCGLFLRFGALVTNWDVCSLRCSVIFTDWQTWRSSS